MGALLDYFNNEIKPANDKLADMLEKEWYEL